MKDETSSESLLLGRLGRALRRHWRLILAAGLVGVVVALGYLTVMPRQATATSVVNINVISHELFNNQRAASTLIDTQTESQLAGSAVVLNAAAAKLGEDAHAAHFRSNLDVKPLPLSTIVRISFTAGSVDDAVAGADAIAESYLDLRSSQAEERVNAATKRLNDRRDDLRGDLVEANTVLSQAKPGSAAAIQAESDAQLLNMQLNTLVAELDAVQAIDTGGGVVVTSAADNPVSIRPARALTVAVGTVLGLVIGVGLAMAVDRFGKKVADPRALAAAGGGTTLAALTTADAEVPAGVGDLEVFRSLRERLLATVPGGAVLGVVDLTSEGQDAPSDVGANLAIVLAESGSDVRLVMAGGDDSLRDALTTAMDLKDEGPVAGHAAWRALRSRVMPSLLVVEPNRDASGSEGPAGNVTADALAGLLTQGPEAASSTVVYLPPGASRSARLAAARLGHTLILIATEGGTRISAVSRLAEEVRAVNATIHGTVVVPRGRRLLPAPSPEPSPREGVAEDEPLDRVLRGRGR